MWAATRGLCYQIILVHWRESCEGRVYKFWSYNQLNVNKVASYSEFLSPHLKQKKGQTARRLVCFLSKQIIAQRENPIIP